MAPFEHSGLPGVTAGCDVRPGSVLPPVLIAAYPRSGSTSLAKCLSVVMGESYLHEPFRQQRGTGSFYFNDLANVVGEHRLIKHHPGNLLSRRQNTELYQAWLNKSGKIVHLIRGDVEAQAKSMAIARSLNSYHRPHQVNEVPTQRVQAELAALKHEIDYETDTLSQFDPIVVRYEDLFAGSLAQRRDHFQALLQRLDPTVCWAALSLEQRTQVDEYLSPRSRVSQPAAERVRLVDQVPLICKSASPFATGLIDEIARSALPIAPAEDVLEMHGVTSLYCAHPSIGAHLREIITQLSTASLDADPVAPIRLMRYDGDTTPDADVGVFADKLPATTSIAFSLCIEAPTNPGEGRVRLSGRNTLTESEEPGLLTLWTTTYGARRDPITAGSAQFLTGAFAVDPDQILSAGQLLGDDGLFVT